MQIPCLSSIYKCRGLILYSLLYYCLYCCFIDKYVSRNSIRRKPRWWGESNMLIWGCPRASLKLFEPTKLQYLLMDGIMRRKVAFKSFIQGLISILNIELYVMGWVKWFTFDTMSNNSFDTLDIKDELSDKVETILYYQTLSTQPEVVASHWVIWIGFSDFNLKVLTYPLIYWSDFKANFDF